MVEVTFVSRAAHFVSLSLLKSIAASSDAPEDVVYIGEKGLNAIKGSFYTRSISPALKPPSGPQRHGAAQQRKTECAEGGRGYMGGYNATCRERWVGRGRLRCIIFEGEDYSKGGGEREWRVWRGKEAGKGETEEGW